MTPDLLKYPKNGPLTPKRGLNLIDNRFEVKPDEALTLTNMLFVRDSLVQRRPFRPYSSIDYVTPGRFRGAHDYQAPGAGARLLYYLDDGTIREWATSSTENTRVSSLATAIEGYFATVYDAVVFANGSDTPRVGRGTTWRTFGSPAAVSTLAVGTGAGATIAAGTYIHTVIPVIDVSGVAVVFGDWSNLVRTVLGGAIGQFNLTWTDISDSRITRYLIFRTEAGTTDLRSVGVVNAGVGAFTDNFADSSLPVTVTGSPSRPSPQSSWGTAPIAKHVTFCGQRVVMANIASGSLQNAIKLSRKAANSYDAEGFPSDNSTLIRMPHDGDITAVIPVGNTESNGQANDLFIGQPTACYILPETNPAKPIYTISESLGVIASRAWAKYGSWLFFQSRRGVEFWPGSGRDIFLVSEQIAPVFNGGGNSQLTANQSDEDIRYEIHENQLWITVRDDATATGPNKAYCLDLNKFRAGFNAAYPSTSARFSGPMLNEERSGTNLGFGLLLRRHDGSLICFDNQNNRILVYDDDADQDSIDANDTDMRIALEFSGILRENVSPQKIMCYLLAYIFTNSSITVTVKGEFDRIMTTATVTPNNYGMEWTDIEWTDIEWVQDTWFQDVVLDFMSAVGKWFGLRIEKVDSEASTAYFGVDIFFDSLNQRRTLR